MNLLLHTKYLSFNFIFMFVVTLISGITFKLEAERAQAIMILLQKGEKHIAIEGQGLIAASAISTILTYEKWKKEQDRLLSMRNKFLCENNVAHDIENGCGCKPLANENPKESLLLLGMQESRGVSRETIARVTDAIAKLSLKMDANNIKNKDIEWDHDNFLRAHPGLHEFSEDVKHAYNVTGL